LTEADETVVERVEELADKKGYTMTQVSMAWLLQKGAIPIIGFSKVERIDEALGVRGKTLTDEEMKYLEEPYKPKEISGHQ
jgi:aryl-alcohol dehydrogenase-like predicted oxidoreductase